MAESSVRPHDESSEPLVPAEVNGSILEQLLEMGFPRNRAVRMIYFSEAEVVEQALNWLTENEEAEDLDEPLLVKPKKQLTEEEKRQRMEELRRVAKEKREREEKEAERLREKDRIRAGKEIQAAMQKEKEQELQRMVELRKREKAEDKKAKEKIRLKLEEDRRERRRQRGLPEELTEEEMAKEEAKRLEKAKEEEERLKKHLGFAKPVGVLEKLRVSLVDMKKDSGVKFTMKFTTLYDVTGDAAFKTACQVLMKYVGNVAKNPHEEKFRRIRLSNAAFVEKVASVQGSLAFLNICGFVPDDSGLFLEMKHEDVNVETLNAAGTVISGALSNPFFGTL